MIENYLSILKSLQFNDTEFLQYKEKLMSYPNEKSLEETFSWIVCVLALKAANNGNIGVGAILVKNNQIIHEACNEMLNPYFRSDAHPEMMVLNEYEANNTITAGSMKTLVMYSSLEPCPMCTTRISTTGIGVVKYVTSHPTGMASSINRLPILWQVLCEDIKITEADCSSELKTLSGLILNSTAGRALPKILANKGGPHSERKWQDSFKTSSV